MSDAINKLAKQAAEFVAEDVKDSLDEALGDSPIEKIFFCALSARIRFGGSEYDRLYVLDERAAANMESEGFRLSTIVIQPQVQFDWGRADFVIHAFDFARKGGPQGWRKLIVECDGHDFHERTKAQARKDRSRDRAAQLSDMEVFRFTGSELWADPWGCAGQVLDWAVKGWP